MLTTLKVLEYKEQYGEVYSIGILDKEYIFRLLTKAEYELIDSMDCSEEEKEELVYFKCVFDAVTEIDNMQAGIISLLCETILYVSGFDEQSAIEIGNQYKEEMLQPDRKIEAMILEAFPNLTLEEVESWTVNKTLKYFSRAAWILYALRGVDVSVLLSDPEQKVDYIEPVDRGY
jgi:hypothetical protein